MLTALHELPLLNDPEPVDETGKQRSSLRDDGRHIAADARSQQAVCRRQPASAFANLDREGQQGTGPYCSIIVRQFVAMFRQVQVRNMFILYDCVQTLAEHVGPAHCSGRPRHNSHAGAYPAFGNKVSDHQEKCFPLLECLSYVATALGGAFERNMLAGIFQPA
ncbi:hypothetical protein FQR65_LT20822 [Abscondita terminalis]|nr:hypothetical protein FQR65_LT20822 [Abscondita terminalis]